MRFLKYIFCFGLSEPIKSWLPEGKFNVILKNFIDNALMVAGSSFTVGVAEEGRDTASVTKMADAPEGTHKMAEGTTHHQFPGSRHESLHVSADLPESLHVSADLPESLHVSADPPESLHVSADPPESHNMPTIPGSALVLPAKPGSALVRPAMPESPARMATMPADAPLWPGLIASVLDPPLVSVRAAGIPRSAALSAPEPAPSQELAESTPEPLRLRSSQSPALQGPCWFRPALQSPCWFRPALQSPCWSRPAHLRLRWSHPAHLRLRWPRPAHLLRWFRPV